MLARCAGCSTSTLTGKAPAMDIEEVDESYDLVVIGSGPAGQVAAELAASFGRRVLIVERNKPGGVVTTTGGAPTKALREAALYLTGYRQEEVYGVRAAAPLEVVLPTLRARVERVRDVLQGVVADPARRARHRLPPGNRPTRGGPHRPRHLARRRGARAGAARGPAGDGITPGPLAGRSIRRSRRLRLRPDLLDQDGAEGHRHRRRRRGRRRVRQRVHRARHSGDAGQPVRPAAAGHRR